MVGENIIKRGYSGLLNLFKSWFLDPPFRLFHRPSILSNQYLQVNLYRERNGGTGTKPRTKTRDDDQRHFAHTHHRHFAHTHHRHYGSKILITAFQPPDHRTLRAI
ncbi:hypothetical protein M426DRAFT_182942 [Hypoxylon sp. CI-4A]|nr:hypothetical protein M426DRAFT_182942 [Hypoxylon sp. CI-4A]